MELPTNGSGIGRFIRLQDLFWVVLFGALVLWGPNRNNVTIPLLCILGALQLGERAILSLKHGGLISFLCKLVICYLLIGYTEINTPFQLGIQSSYFWMMLLPIMTVATTLSLFGTVLATMLVCAAYLSFWLYLPPQMEIIPEQTSELILRVLLLPVVGYLAHQLVESHRITARKYQMVAEQLTEANLQLQEAEAAVRRSERLVALGQLSAGLAHELRNPLGTMKASAEMLVKNLTNADELSREMAGFISTEVDRTNSLITRFLDFARPLALQLDRTDLTQIVDRAIADVERHQPPFDVSIYKNYSPEMQPFPLDGELMERVFYNLILNAAQASPPRGTITVKTRQIDDTAEIAVIDLGSGVDPKHFEHIFNPFFTTKRDGVGLGLAIVSKIVDEHGGRMTVESEPGHGSVFRVYLPMRPDQQKT